MTLTEKKMLKKWKSDSAIQLGESCRSDTLSDIEGFKEERAGMEKKEHAILQIDADAPQMQGVAAQNSCSNSRSNLNRMFAAQYAIVTLTARFVSFIMWAHCEHVLLQKRGCGSGSHIMLNAVQIILLVAGVILFLHLFEVF